MRPFYMLASLAVTGLVALTLSGCNSEPAPDPEPGPTRAAVIVEGKTLFLRCASCHSLSAQAPLKTGPHLADIVGRKGGSVPGFKYSPGLQATQPVWNEANLDAWLAAPAKVVPGTSMAFAGLPDPADRKALIAYLKDPR